MCDVTDNCFHFISIHKESTPLNKYKSDIILAVTEFSLCVTKHFVVD